MAEARDRDRRNERPEGGASIQRFDGGAGTWRLRRGATAAALEAGPLVATASPVSEAISKHSNAE
jgi:hypothetical protein